MNLHDSTPDITLRSPAELLSAVPYLVGYHPRDRVVFIGLDDHGIQVVSAMPHPAAREPLSRLPIVETVLRHHELDAAIIVGYGAADRVTRCVDQLRQVCAEREIDVVEALRVSDGRYWSYICANARCCPPEGTPLAPPDSVVDARFTLNGVQALPDRDAVAAQLNPVTGAERGRVTKATRRLAGRLADPESVLPPREYLRANSRGILNRLIGKGEVPTVADAVLLSCALGDRRWADPELCGEAMIGIDEYGPTVGLDAWVWLTRHADPAQRAVPAALLAFAAWRAGNGVLANEAVRRALTDDPDCGPAKLLGRVLKEGVPPSSIPPLRRGGDTDGITAEHEEPVCAGQSSSRASPE